MDSPWYISCGAIHTYIHKLSAGRQHTSRRPNDIRRLAKNSVSMKCFDKHFGTAFAVDVRVSGMHSIELAPLMVCKPVSLQATPQEKLKYAGKGLNCHLVNIDEWHG